MNFPAFRVVVQAWLTLAALGSARAAERASRDAAAQVLLDWNQRVLQSRDAAEGVSAFVEHRPPVFEGR